MVNSIARGCLGKSSVAPAFITPLESSLWRCPGGGRAQAFLNTLELDVAESKRLFDLLDDGGGNVHVEDFVQGAMRLKGQARSLDVITIMRDCSGILRRLDRLCQSVNALHAGECVQMPVGAVSQAAPRAKSSVRHSGRCWWGEAWNPEGQQMALWTRLGTFCPRCW